MIDTKSFFLNDGSTDTTSYREFLFYVGHLGWDSPIIREHGYSMQLLNTDDRLVSMYLMKTNCPSSLHCCACGGQETFCEDMLREMKRYTLGMFRPHA